MFAEETATINAIAMGNYESCVARIRGAVARLKQVDLTGENDTVPRRRLAQFVVRELTAVMETTLIGEGYAWFGNPKEPHLLMSNTQALRVLLGIDKALEGLQKPASECPEPPPSSVREGPATFCG